MNSISAATSVRPAETDRELLELAAKAAGIEVDDGMRCLWGYVGSSTWNPLNDDGDALRLAARLGLSLHYYKAHGETRALVRAELGAVYAIEFYVDDTFAATRRAIVLAAAEFGRAIPV